MNAIAAATVRQVCARDYGDNRGQYPKHLYRMAKRLWRSLPWFHRNDRDFSRIMGAWVRGVDEARETLSRKGGRRRRR